LAALRDVLLYVNTGGHECLEFQLRRYLRAGFLNNYEFSNPRTMPTSASRTAQSRREGRQVVAAYSSTVYYSSTRDVLVGFPASVGYTVYMPCSTKRNKKKFTDAVA